MAAQGKQAPAGKKTPPAAVPQPKISPNPYQADLTPILPKTK